jgi:hypothetical protein
MPRNPDVNRDICASSPDYARSMRAELDLGFHDDLGHQVAFFSATPVDACVDTHHWSSNFDVGLADEYEKELRILDSVVSSCATS